MKKITINSDQKKLLEELTGLNLSLRIASGQNHSAITDLIEQARQNAAVYLERNSLGQKLSLFEENNLFSAVVSLQNLIGMSKIPRRIECYDISHLSGKFVYGSMVTFIDGRPAKKFYKLFKTKEQNNDFENHQEVLTRRLKKGMELPGNEGWQFPDLIIVDGGKGQLSSDYGVLEEFKLTDSIFMVALAKKEEELFVPNQAMGIQTTGDVRFLIQRIRDEAHRFAITNNRKARLRTISQSQLDEVPGVGPKTKQKLLSVFGSVESVVKALDQNPELLYELVGKNVVTKLKQKFG